MATASFPRLRRWRRLARFCDSLLLLCRVHVGVTLENLSEVLGPTASSGRSRKKTPPVRLNFYPLEERAFPGQTVGMLGWGLIGTGLSLIDRSLAQPPSIQSRGLGDLGGTARSHPALGANDPPHAQGGSSSGWDSFNAEDARRAALSGQAQSSAGFGASGVVNNVLAGNVVAGSPDPATAGAAANPLADPFVDPLVDAITGQSVRPKPPVRIPNDGLESRKWNDGYGGNNGTSSSANADTRNGQTSPMPPNTTFNQDGSPKAPPSSSLPHQGAKSGAASPISVQAATGGRVQPGAGPTVPLPVSSLKSGHGKPLTPGHDPLWVLDVNKGLVVTPGVVSYEFSNWTVDLQAQVSGATVSTYSWDLSQASDATSVTGQGGGRFFWFFSRGVSRGGCEGATPRFSWIEA